VGSFWRRLGGFDGFKVGLGKDIQAKHLPVTACKYSTNPSSKITGSAYF